MGNGYLRAVWVYNVRPLRSSVRDILQDGSRTGCAVAKRTLWSENVHASVVLVIGA